MVLTIQSIEIIVSPLKKTPWTHMNYSAPGLWVFLVPFPKMQCPYKWLLFEEGKGRMEERATVLAWVTRRENCQRKLDGRK